MKEKYNNKEKLQKFNSQFATLLCQLESLKLRKTKATTENEENHRFVEKFNKFTEAFESQFKNRLKQQIRNTGSSIYDHLFFLFKRIWCRKVDGKATG